MRRRKFIRNSAMAAAALSLLRCKAENTKSAIESEIVNRVGDFGLQLWSVRYLMDEDPVATLEALAGIGYKTIEGTGSCYKDGKFFGIEKKDFANLLNDLGLKMQSIHTPGTGKNSDPGSVNMTHRWEEYCDAIAEMGVHSAILAWLPEGERETMDDYKYTVDLVNKCADAVISRGMKMAYHNHDFEFLKIDDQVPYDYMLQNTDASKVNFEMDHYWVAKAGADSVEYFNKYPGRFHYWHVKDMAPGEDKFFAPVGKGIIDYKRIFQHAELSGMKHFYVEQDEYRDYEPLESMQIGHDYLRDMQY